MNEPQAALLSDGRRLHLNHGPIDLIVEGFGAASEVGHAYEQATSRFRTILRELVAELPMLRQPAGIRPRDFEGRIARRMEAAASRHARVFITPMAAVAGAVADEVLRAATDGRRVSKAYVNNGGDTALYLAGGEEFRVGIVAERSNVNGRAIVRAEDPIRGIATSGWRGRSFSLGIADAVTVMARTAAEADAAATVIANAVDLPGHPGISREPASALAPDSDLGMRLVTTQVAKLRDGEVDIALSRGLRVAESMCKRGLIVSAALQLQGRWRAAEKSPAERMALRKTELERVK